MGLSDVWSGQPLSRATVKALAAAGIGSMDDIARRSAREVGDIRGIGPKALVEIRAALDAAGLAFAADPFGPYMCVREGMPKRDANLATFLLCDQCAARWIDEPFAGEEPVFVGGAYEGHCLNCNEYGQVRMLQWFLCGNCERVARSIGRSIVAARSAIEAWNDAVRPTVGLALVDTDPPRLMRQTPHGHADRRAVATADLLAQRDDGTPVLGIEMKTGRAYVEGSSIGTKMGRFQLDISDCNEIIAVTQRDHIPIYLMHVQVIDRASPPTLRKVAIGHWWTDPFAMEAAFLNIANRGRETRPAAYYNTRMFRRLSALADHIAGDGVDDVAGALADRHWRPPLYPEAKSADVARLEVEVEDVDGNEG